MSTVVAPSTSSTDLRTLLDAYVSTRRGRPVTVDGLRRLAGGASRETWGFDLHDPEGAGTEALVLRRDFAHGPLDADLQAEFDLLMVLYANGVPVPRPYWCEVDDPTLGLPFAILERIEGTDVRKALADRGRTPDRASMGLELTRLQAAVHGTPAPPRLGLGSPPRAEVERWAGAIAAATSDPGPLVRTAIAWLRTHAPGPGRVGLVHGDFKTNNLLLGPNGGVTVLDWELAHLGDPIEDLAWTLLWSTEYDLIGGLLSEDAYLRAYEDATGHPVDRTRLEFWRMLALVKLAAIFFQGAAGPRDRHSVRPTLQLLARSVVHVEHRIGELLRTALGRSDR